jgi:hypothetical protein
VIDPAHAVTAKTVLTMQNPDELSADLATAKQEYQITDATGGLSTHLALWNSQVWVIKPLLSGTATSIDTPACCCTDPSPWLPASQLLHVLSCRQDLLHA